MSDGKEGKEHKITNAAPYAVRTRGDEKGGGEGERR